MWKVISRSDFRRNFMTTIIDHNKLLTKIAKARFKQTSIRQKGQSRMFLQDNFWYTTLIEFQPSGYDKGTFLNIGVDFNFYPRDHFTFSFGNREKEFIKFESQAQFENAVNSLCELTLKRTSEIQSQLATYSNATATLKKTFNPTNSWQNFDLGIITALSGDKTNAKILLEKVISGNCGYEWEKDRKEFTVKLLDWLNSDSFNNKINEEIILTRKLKKLDK
jgi:hypothetical protein